MTAPEQQDAKRGAEPLELPPSFVKDRRWNLAKRQPPIPAGSGPLPDAMRACIPHALGLARNTVARLNPPATPAYQWEDWDAIGRLAALQALATYQAAAGPWQSWVIAKVRWAIADELRRMAPFPRRQWASLQAEERERLALAGVPEAEITARLEDFARQLFAAPMLPNRTYERVWDDHEAIASEPSWAPDPLEWLWARAVREAVRALPERLRQPLIWQQEGYTRAEIGGRLGVGESRVRQLLAAARDRLRAQLAPWMEAP